MKIPFGIFVGRIIINILRPLFFLIFPYKFINKDKIPQKDGPLVVCCNHISLLDPFYLYLSLNRPIYFMAKSELFKNPLIGLFLTTFFGVFPVARGKGDFIAITHSLSILENGRVLGIYPEGTRSKDGKLGMIKSGTSLIVAKAQSPVLPCVLFTKDNRVRAFRRTTLVFGDVMTPDDMHLSGEKPDLRYATRKISSTFNDLLEEYRA